MSNDAITQYLITIRHAATQLAADLGADPRAAAPLLHALALLEEHLTPLDGTPVVAHADVPLARLPHTHLDALVHAAPIGMCMIHGSDLRYRFTNPAYDRIVGRTDLVGKTVRAAYPELADQGSYELLEAIYAQGDPIQIPDRLIRLDRQGHGVLDDIYVDVLYHPVKDATGMVTHIMTYVWDVSDRHALEQERAAVLTLTQEAHQAADKERQRLLTILHQAPAAISIVEEPDHIFTFTNPRHDAFVGRADLIGQSARTVFPQHVAHGLVKRLDQIYATGIPFLATELPIYLDRTGSSDVAQFFVNILYAPLRNADGTITGIMTHAVDVTELVTARQQAEDAVRARDQFLSMTAHELRAPITALLAALQLLHLRLQRGEGMNARITRSLTMAETQIQRLNRLVSTIVEVTRMQTGHFQLQLMPLDLCALTSHMVEEVRSTQDADGIQMVIPDQPCMIHGDDLRLEQVLLNLLQNALKYSHPGNAIIVTVACTATHAWIRVQDHGIGIPADALPHIFEPFYRVTEGAAQFIQGMGLGLAVVHEIVTAHGGTITVDSTVGSGSTFTIWLPRCAAAATF